MTRVLVCGGRRYARRGHLFNTLYVLHISRGFSLVIHGDAGLEDDQGRVICGADKLAGAWASTRRIPVLPLESEWEKYGDAAGTIRSRDLLKVGKPDLVVAFAGGAGTANMVTLSLRAGVPVIQGG